MGVTFVIPKAALIKRVSKCALVLVSVLPFTRVVLKWNTTLRASVGESLTRSNPINNDDS